LNKRLHGQFYFHICILGLGFYVLSKNLFLTSTHSRFPIGFQLHNILIFFFKCRNTVTRWTVTRERGWGWLLFRDNATETDTLVITVLCHDIEQCYENWHLYPGDNGNLSWYRWMKWTLDFTTSSICGMRSPPVSDWLFNTKTRAQSRLLWNSSFPYTFSTLKLSKNKNR